MDSTCTKVDTMNNLNVVDRIKLVGVNTLFYLTHDTLLHLASENSELDIIEPLLKNGAKIDAMNKFGNTPLHYAVLKGRLEVVEFLLKKEAVVDAKDKDGNTALHLACRNSNKELINLLLKEGTDVNTKNKLGNTPLHLACRNGNEKLINLLLTKSADVNTKNKLGDTPLHLACRNGNEELINLLLENGADVKDNNNNRSRTPLHEVIKHGNSNVNVVDLLLKNYLKKEAKIDAKDNFLNTPLHLAVMHSKLPVVKLLVDSGADIHLTNWRSKTAMDLAHKYKKWEILNFLTEKDPVCSIRGIFKYRIVNIPHQRKVRTIRKAIIKDVKYAISKVVRAPRKLLPSETDIKVTWSV